jgi:hypothetical protein
MAIVEEIVLGDAHYNHSEYEHVWLQAFVAYSRCSRPCQRANRNADSRNDNTKSRSDSHQRTAHSNP